MALGFGLVLVGGASVAAQDVSGNPPPMRAEGELESLLRKIEQQIFSGQSVSPPNDSATETWKIVLRLEKTSPTSARIRSALADFVVRMRIRAGEEKTAGHHVTASDLTIYADQASDLLRQSDATAISRIDTSQTTSSRPVGALPEVAVSPVKLPGDPPFIGLAAGPTPPPLPDAGGPVAAPERTAVPADLSTVSGVSAVASHANAKVERQVMAPPIAIPGPGDDARGAQPDDLEIYVKRGDEMVAAKDISAARKFYGYAAAAGSAHAAIALARTYDPNYLAQTGTKEIKPNQQPTTAHAEPAADRRQPETRQSQSGSNKIASRRHQPPRHVTQLAVVSHTPVPFFQRIANNLHDLFNR